MLVRNNVLNVELAYQMIMAKAKAGLNAFITFTELGRIGVDIYYDLHNVPEVEADITDNMLTISSYALHYRSDMDYCIRIRQKGRKINMDLFRAQLTKGLARIICKFVINVIPESKYVNTVAYVVSKHIVHDNIDIYNLADSLAESKTPGKMIRRLTDSTDKLSSVYKEMLFGKRKYAEEILEHAEKYYQKKFAYNEDFPKASFEGMLGYHNMNLVYILVYIIMHEYKSANIYIKQVNLDFITAFETDCRVYSEMAVIKQVFDALYTPHIEDKQASDQKTNAKTQKHK